MDGNPVLMTGSRNAGTSASEGGTVYHYTRDSEGRILTKSAWGKTLYETSYGADGKPLGIVAQGVRTDYTYDPAGNLTEEHSTEHKKIYFYDTYNRNTEITGNDFTQKNHYDAEGYRYSIEEKQSCFLLHY